MIVGLTGSFGSGCTTIGQFLTKDEGFRSLSLSEFVRSEVENELGTDKWKTIPFKDKRRLLQDKGDQLREPNNDVTVEHVLDTVRELQQEGRDIVIDSIRSPHEVKRLRTEFGDFWLLAVEAERGTRWARCKDSYDGDESRFDEDDARDSGEDQPRHGQHVRECVQLTDVCVINDIHCQYPADWDELFAKVDGFVSLMRTPRYRLPSLEESFMAQAYLSSLNSACSRRLVGAVVVSPDGDEVVSSGFNHFPDGNRTCGELGGPGYCYREARARDKLAMMKYCPRCGKEIPSSAASASLPWKCGKCSAKLPHDFVPGKMLDLCRALHAEEDAILQAKKLGGTSLRECILYTTTFPCPLCAKMIADVGIERVVYVEPYPMPEAIEIFDNSNPMVLIEKYEGVHGRAFTRMFGPSKP